MLETYDSSNNLIENETNSTGWGGVSPQENIINLQVEILDFSNVENILGSDISRSLLLEHLLNIENNVDINNIDESQNSISFLTLLENNLNNLNNILQNTLYTNSESPFIQNFIDSTFEIDNKKKFKRVTDDEELKKLKIQKFDKNKIYANNECPINLRKFAQDDEIIILPCNHVYSCEEIKKWLNEESNCCPTCRYELEYKEIKCEENNNNLEEIESLDVTNYIVNNYNNNYNDEEDIILQQILLNSYSSSR